MFGLYGKHPAFGDFLSNNLTATAEAALIPWMTEVFAAVRDGLGDEWTGVFDAAAPLRFWVGGNIFGSAPLFGVVAPSRDRVGRRFPLLLVAEDWARQPPVLDSDQQVYEALEAHIAALEPEVDKGARGLLAGLPEFEPDDSAAEAFAPGYWAANPSAPVEELFGTVRDTDHLRAAALRSYWWSAGTERRAAALYSCTGLPEADGMRWLLGGMAAESLEQA